MELISIYDLPANYNLATTLSRNGPYINRIQTQNIRLAPAKAIQSTMLAMEMQEEFPNGILNIKSKKENEDNA